jgi:uncharacterized protein
MDLPASLGGLPSPLVGLALVLGALIMVAGVLAIVLTLVGIGLSLLFMKKRQVVIPEVTLFILTLLEAPIRYLLWVFKIEGDVVSRLVVEVRNRLYRDRFDRTPYEQRAMFIPQCLRSPNCPAPLTPDGIRCLDCGRCGIGKIKGEAESLGYKVFIAPGGSLIKRMLKKYQSQAVLGVGCPMEVKEGTEKMASYGLPVQGIILERDGCVDTRVDVVKLLEKIKSQRMAKGRFTIESDKPYLKKALGISEMWVNAPSDDLKVEDENKKGAKTQRR